MNRKLYNIIIMSIGFMLVFMAFQTIQNMEKALFRSIYEEDSTFTGDAYISLAIVYAVFALSIWLAPSFIALTGPRASIVTGSFMFTIYILSLLHLTTWLLYVVSVCLGIGAALLWTGQGVFLTRCSSEQTISRNTGIFWIFYQSSGLFGNIFVFLELRNKDSIDQSTRTTVIAVLAGLVILGNAMFLTFCYVPDENNNDNGTPKTSLKAAWFALQSSAHLFITYDILILITFFMYTGLTLAFIGGIYANAVGFTHKLANTPKEAIALVGLCLGIGEIIGGAMYGILAPKVERLLIDPLILSGYVSHMLAFILIWLNLPNNSTYGETNDISVFNPPLLWLALFCAILLSLGDACFHVQVYIILGTFYVQQSAEAFAIFMFVQSLAAAGAFVYSFYIDLTWQLLILLVSDTLATFCLYLVKWRKRLRNYQSK